MKKTITIVFASVILMTSCDVVNNAANHANNIINSDGSETESANPLTNVEVISGLREALNVGIENSVKKHFGC